MKNGYSLKKKKSSGWICKASAASNIVAVPGLLLYCHLNCDGLSGLYLFFFLLFMKIARIFHWL